MKSNRADSSEDYSFLPDYLQWVAMHPGLRMQPGAQEGRCDKCERPFVDPVVAAIRREYELNRPAPNDMALNYYEHCLADDKFKSDTFKEVNRLCLEERKRKKSGGSEVSPKVQEEMSRVSILRQELDELKKKRQGVVS